MKLALSDRQISKVYNGHPIQLRHDQLGHGYGFPNLHPELVKKINKAMQNKKGVRIHISQDELMQGEGIKEFFQKLAKGAKKVINSDFYQKNVRPIARKLVEEAIDLNPLPEKDLQKNIARRVGDKTRAFGMAGGSIPPVTLKKPRGRPKKDISFDGSSFLPSGY